MYEYFRVQIQPLHLKFDSIVVTHFCKARFACIHTHTHTHIQMAAAALSTKALFSQSSSIFPPSRPPNQRPQTIVIKSRKNQSRPFIARASFSSSSPSPLPSVSGFNQSIGEVLGNVSIFTASTGERVRFQNLWDQNEGMAVVALLRHFGCPCCWELASTLKEVKPRFDSAGVKLIAVGVGTPDKARILAERLPFPLDSLYADPERKAYDVLGLYYGLGRTFFNPASAKVLTRFESMQKAVKNYTISATPEDRSSVLQQGGMFVFKGNKLLYARKDEGTGDHAPLDDILGICCNAPVA